LNLAALGWDASFADAFEPYRRADLIPARVAARHHGPCELLTERGRLGGIPAGRLREALGQGHIGLASSLERVEAIGGRMRVGARADGLRGTQATATLPLA
jgi:hypothetical protein